MKNKDLLAKIQAVAKAYALSERLKENTTHEDTSAIMDSFHKACNLLEGEYHKDKDILTLLEEIAENADEDSEIDEDSLSDSIFEQADSACPVYYNDIAKWFSDGNWNAVDEYTEEVGDTNAGVDVMKLIQSGFVFTLEREARNTLHSIIANMESEEEHGALSDDEDTTA